jgi:hypothetical protein
LDCGRLFLEGDGATDASKFVLWLCDRINSFRADIVDLKERLSNLEHHDRS